jgi:UDP-N-acetyl-D-glucosamine dehydrogenase
VVIVTDHTAVDYEFVAAHSRLVVDTRNVMRKSGLARDNIRDALDRELSRDFAQ